MESGEVALNRADAYRAIVRAHVDEKIAIVRIIRARLERRVAGLRLRHPTARDWVEAGLVELRSRLETVARSARRARRRPPPRR